MAVIFRQQLRRGRSGRVLSIAIQSAAGRECGGLRSGISALATVRVECSSRIGEARCRRGEGVKMTTSGLVARIPEPPGRLDGGRQDVRGIICGTPTEGRRCGAVAEPISIERRGSAAGALGRLGPWAYGVNGGKLTTHYTAQYWKLIAIAQL
jgi:hypothetical protein